MYPEKEMVIFHVESSLHAGAGAAIGHIDNPLQRDTSTGNPIVQANGVKGALREFFEKTCQDKNKEIEAVFGTADGNDGAGAVSFGEARLLFFPVRSLAGIFAYITCPSVIARFQRDLTALGKTNITITNGNGKKIIWHPAVLDDNYQAHTESLNQLSTNDGIVLEELPFASENGNIDGCLGKIANALFPEVEEYAPFKSEFPKRAVVLSDSDYFHFVRYSTEVEPHNRIDDEKGTVDERTGVWYTEYLPSESILYCPLFIGKPHIQNNAFADATADATSIKKFLCQLKGQRTWLGGDRTTGKGRVMMHLFQNQEG